MPRERLRRAGPVAANGGGAPSGLLHQTTALRIGGAIVGQTALLTALLLYFGWARTRATFAYFGVDLSLLDFSTTEYVLRSVNSAYRPLLWLGLLFLAGTALHRYLPRSAGRWVLGVGGALVAIGVIALLWGAWSRQIGSWIPDSSPLGFAWLPVVLATGFALLAYGTLQEALAGGQQLVFALLALFVMALFWAVSLVAVHDGRARALAIERTLPASPEVVVLATDLMAIRGPGVVLTDLRVRGDEDGYGRYRNSYSGLRLLIHTDDKYFLLPVGWRHSRDRVFQLPDDEHVRIELIAR